LHKGTEGKTAVAAQVPGQRWSTAEAKTEDSDELPPDKHQRKDSGAESVAQWQAHMAGDDAQGVGARPSQACLHRLRGNGSVTIR
jgi:hypothetical protein